ncbi:MAG: chromosome segregation protein SMC [Armatimonadetes bacterium]|nr:chromosome segregation protein SMC [Armatimonadota bacterium]
MGPCDGNDGIFAGSAQRRPLGYAEVTLTVDNSDGALPLPMREVAVTRRAYRNGDTEYRINHQRCRRKDIIDLFLDTGVGRQAFSVISQREIDAILSLDPRDRRRLLEEVAGIERYRARRDETLRRLDDTAANLTRLSDLMLALELRVEPLREQREIARGYLVLRERVAQLKLSLLVKDHDLLEKRLLRHDEEVQESARRVTEARTALSAAEADEEQARLDLLQTDDELQSARERMGEAAREVERFEAAVRVAEERLRHLAERRQATAQALERHQARVAESEAQAEAVRAETVRTEAELGAARAAVAELESATRARREDEQQVETRLAAQRREVAELNSRIGALEGSRSAAAETLANAGRRREALAEQLRQAAEALVRARSAGAAATAALETAQAELNRLQAEQQALRDALAAGEREQARLRDSVGELRARLGERAARLGVLQAAADSYEGLFGGVRAVLQARDRGRLRGDYQVVADLLRVADGWDVAIESALGARLQDLVCERGEDAEAAIEFLKQERAGRATFLPLDLLEDGARPSGAERLRGMLGVVGLGVDLVCAPHEFDLVRRHLLSNLIVVESLDAGLAVRRAGFTRSTIVTRDGDLIRSSGAITGGSQERRGTALLARKRELERLEREHETLSGELATATAQEQRLSAAGRDQRSGMQALESALQEARRRHSAAERTRLEAQMAVTQGEREAARLAEVAGEVEVGESAARATVGEAEGELTELRALRAERMAALGGVEAAATEVRTRRAGDDDALSAAKVRAARLESRLQSLHEQSAGHRKLRESADLDQRRLAAEGAGLDEEHRRVEAELLRGRQEWSTRRAAQEEQNAALEALQAVRRDAGEAVSRAVEAARAARTAVDDSQQAQHRAELRRTSVDGELLHLRQTLADDHDGLTPEQARGRAEEIPNRADAAMELQARREELAELGDVNLGAIEEFERVTEQLLFYERQKADLEEARDDLMEVIAEIDGVTRERLAEAFTAVNREFKALFLRVFGADGEAALQWSDPEDILDSGLEVLVRLPGKRVQHLLLLSGGERAMTTITLLLAMFRVKPSPCCLLDELDAPLDDANLRKYRDLLREFSAGSQFIVITHNPETTRVANTLYGITMEEPGVSRAYSYRPPAETEAPARAIRAAD